MSLGEICLKTNMELQSQIKMLEAQTLRAIDNEEIAKRQLETCEASRTQLMERLDVIYDTLKRKVHDLEAIYTERARLLALLGAIYPSHLFIPDDASEGFPGAICIHFPWGKGTWHLSAVDVNLFPKTEVTPSDWDGESTESKYQGIEHAVEYRNVGAYCYLCGGN